MPHHKTDFLTRLGKFFSVKKATFHGPRHPPAPAAGGGAPSRDTWGHRRPRRGRSGGRANITLSCAATTAARSWDDALSRDQEFRLPGGGPHRAGVPAPRARAWVVFGPRPCSAPPFLIMDRLEGESVGRARGARRRPGRGRGKRLPRQMGEQLARIHAVGGAPGLEFLPRPAAGQSPAASAAARAGAQLWRLGETAPGPLSWPCAGWAKHAPACPRLRAAARRLPLGKPHGWAGRPGRHFRLGVRPISATRRRTWPGPVRALVGASVTTHLRLAGVAAPGRIPDGRNREHGGRPVDSFRPALLGNPGQLPLGRSAASPRPTATCSGADGEHRVCQSGAGATAEMELELARPDRVDPRDGGQAMTDRPTAAELVEAVRHLLEVEVVPRAFRTSGLRFPGAGGGPTCCRSSAGSWAPRMWTCAWPGTSWRRCWTRPTSRRRIHRDWQGGRAAAK